jgi:hypothetical protein
MSLTYFSAYFIQFPVSLPFTGKFRRFLPKGLPPLSEQEIIDEQQTLRSIQAANLSVKTGKTYL